jgi:hypothetical protein
MCELAIDFPKEALGVKPSKFGYQLFLKKTPAPSIKLSPPYFTEILCLGLCFVNQKFTDPAEDLITIYFVISVS